MVSSRHVVTLYIGGVVVRPRGEVKSKREGICGQSRYNAAYDHDQGKFSATPRGWFVS